MPASLKTVLEERTVNSPDGGNFFPRFIQPIADSPDIGDHVKLPDNSSRYNDKNRTLPAARKPGRARIGNFTLLRSRESSDTQNKTKRKANTTDDDDRKSHYSSPHMESRFDCMSASSSIDSLTVETENHLLQTLPVYKLASAEFELEYTGGPGATDGYYRKTKLCITARVLPTFHFSHFDILPYTE